MYPVRILAIAPPVLSKVPYDKNVSLGVNVKEENPKNLQISFMFTYPDSQETSIKIQNKYNIVITDEKFKLTQDILVDLIQHLMTETFKELGLNPNDLKGIDKQIRSVLAANRN